MATNRTRRTRGRRPDVNSWQVEFMQFGALSPETELEANPLELLNWTHPANRRERHAIHRVWTPCAPFILPAWIREHPGTRPWAWWEFDAPEPCRRRLGGTGSALHECLRYAPHFRFGLPCFWLDDQHRRLFGGRPGFTGHRIDPDAPPLFESQAAYLQRHRLLTPAERQRLSAADFEPETIQQPKE